MKRNNYYPSRQADQVLWLANFSNKVPGSAAALGLTTAQVAHGISTEQIQLLSSAQIQALRAALIPRSHFSSSGFGTSADPTSGHRKNDHAD